MELTPDLVLSGLFQIAEPRKLLEQLFDSDAGKRFIAERLQLDPDDLKKNLFECFAKTRKSAAHDEAEKRKSDREKLIAYRTLAGRFMREDGMGEFDAVVLAGGVFGLDPDGLADYLRSRGWAATRASVVNYYSRKEAWLKKFLASKKVIVDGWNSEADDLSPIMDSAEPEESSLKPPPDPDAPVGVMEPPPQP